MLFRKTILCKIRGHDKEIARSLSRCPSRMNLPSGDNKKKDIDILASSFWQKTERVGDTASIFETDDARVLRKNSTCEKRSPMTSRARGDVESSDDGGILSLSASTGRHLATSRSISAESQVAPYGFVPSFPPEPATRGTTRRRAR